MNKKDLSAVLLASVLGSAAFVAPVLAEETNTDPQEVETAPVEETTTVEQTETTTPVYTNQFQTVNGSTYYFDNNGNKVTGIQTINGELYYFDGNGVLQTNVEYEGYYFGANGKAVQSDWVKFTDGYKYYDENGQAVKGTSTSPVMKEIDGNSYAFDLNGYMLTGWQEVDGTKYYFAENGVRNDTYKVASDALTVSDTNGTWEKVSGLWKYKLSNGSYATDTVLYIDNHYYAFDSSGYMLTDFTLWVNNGVENSSSGYVRADKNGYLIKGWYKDYDGRYQYFGNNYAAYTDGVYTIGNKQYFFQYNFMVASKTFIYDEKVYMAADSGALTLVDTTNKTDWIEISDGWYDYWYYYENGKLVTNSFKVIGSKKYYFSSDGKMLSNLTYEINGRHYYINESGVVIEKKNAWYQNEDGELYYYKADGSLALKEIYTIGDKNYCFDIDGKLQKNIAYYQYSYYITDDGGALLLSKGWKFVNFEWRYVQENGTLLRNSFLTEGNKKYYLDDNGAMVTNDVRMIDGTYYAFNENGVVTQTVSSFDGWKKIQNEWYYSKNGNLSYTGRVGNNYVSDGKMLTNSIVGAYGETQYYVDYNGEIQKGWIKGYNTWLYADPSTGVLPKSQWLKQGNNWYYIQNGYMITGLLKIDGQLNSFDANGVWKGVVKPNSWYRDPINNLWYYIDAQGKTNYKTTLSLNGVTYYFYVTGMGSGGGIARLAENSFWHDGNTKRFYWTNKTGTGLDTTTGWKKSNNGLYGYVRNGQLVTGLQTINGTKYYFDQTGILWIGVNNVDGKAYVYDKNGNAVQYKEGWNALNGQWYYIKNGRALTNTYIEGYYIGSNGLTMTGLNDDVLLVQGRLARNQWVHDTGIYYNTTYNDDWYYADANGHRVRNKWVGDYYFDNDGLMVKNAWVGNHHVGADGKWDYSK